MLSLNVSVTTGTTEGDTVTLQCEDGLFPVIPVMITCNSFGVWSPNPAELVCTTLSGTYVLSDETETCVHPHNMNETMHADKGMEVNYNNAE